MNETAIPDTADWYSDETATFGDRLAGARDAMGLSQKELASQIGVKHRTILDWENDLNDPRANKLQMLSGVLNVSIVWLLTGVGEGIDADDKRADTDVAEILENMREIRFQITDLTTQLGVLEGRLKSCLRG